MNNSFFKTYYLPALIKGFGLLAQRDYNQSTPASQLIRDVQIADDKSLTSEEALNLAQATRVAENELRFKSVGMAFGLFCLALPLIGMVASFGLIFSGHSEGIAALVASVAFLLLHNGFNLYMQYRYRDTHMSLMDFSRRSIPPTMPHRR